MKTNLCWGLFFCLACAKVRGGVARVAGPRFQTMEKSSWKNKLFLIKANIIFAKGFRISFGTGTSKYSRYTRLGYCLTQWRPEIYWLNFKKQTGKVFEHRPTPFTCFWHEKALKVFHPSTFLHDVLDSWIVVVVVVVVLLLVLFALAFSAQKVMG